jgi:hypothetical protein
MRILHKLLLPAYSSDLNPIEPVGGPVNMSSQKPVSATNPFLFIANVSQCYG